MQKDFEMAGLGYLGNNGGPSSSNLSPLAPPFTVDRSNPNKSNANPLAKAPYGVVPFSSSNNWQYPQSPSVNRPDFGTHFDSEVDSVCTASLPNDYCYLGSESLNSPSTQWTNLNPTLSNPTNPFSYVGAPKQYHPPYASQVVDDGLSLVRVNEASYDLLSNCGMVPVVGSSGVDYTQGLAGVELPTRWGGIWNGVVEGKQDKRIEADGIFRFEEVDFSGSLGYKENKTQGGTDLEGLKNFEDNSAIAHRKYEEVCRRENLSGSLSKGQLDDKLLVQNIRFNPIESTKTPILGNAALISESHQESPSLDTETVSPLRQSFYSPYRKSFQLFDTCVNDCISVTKSSPTLTIKPPTFGTKASILDSVSFKSTDIGNVVTDVDSQNLSVEKGPQFPPSSEGKDGCLDGNHLSFHIGSNNHSNFASSSAKVELSRKPLSRNALGNSLKPRSGAQVPDINVPHSFSLAVGGDEAFKNTATVSESLDYHNPAEDSPCWRGAPASHASPFETLDGMPPQQNHMKKLEACDGLNFHGTPICPSYNDFVKTFSREVRDVTLHRDGFSADNSVSLFFNGNFAANLPKKEQKLENSDNIELNRIGAFQLSDDVDNKVKQYDLLNGSKSASGSFHFHAKQFSPNEATVTSVKKLDLQAGVVDWRIGTSDTSADGSVLHAAENVLCSPFSGEDAEKPHEMESSPKMDLQILVNVVHNISELLLVQCSSDASALKQQDLNVLKHAIRNFELCMSKKIVRPTQAQESMVPMEEISRIIESDRGVKSQTINEVGITSCGLLDSVCKLEQKKRNDISVKEFVTNLDSVSSRDTADVNRHHNMIQDIMKALEENIQLEEEMPSETLLYKNMWLDAEAELCSVGIKSRFDRVKSRMENCASDKAKENLVSLEKLPSSNIYPELNGIHASTPEAIDSPMQKESVHHSCMSSPLSQVDNVEASVMARLQILKSRGDPKPCPEEEKLLPEEVDVDISFMSDENSWQSVKNQHGNKNFDVAVGSCWQHCGGQNKEDKIGSYLDDAPHYETLKELNVGVEDDPTAQPYKNSRLQNQLGSVSSSICGWYENSSLDWEHVVKDDFAWQN